MPGRDWYDRERIKLSKRLFEQVRTRTAEEPLPVIIMFEDHFSQQDEEIRRQIHDLGGRIHRELPVIRGFATVLPGTALSKIAPNAKIKRIHLDRNVRPCLDVAIPTVFADKVQVEGYTGKDVGIAIIDSGIHPHADFMRPTRRLIAWYDAVADRSSPYDDNGHGTHVAGIAAGNGYASDGKYRGVAPGANIIAVKVADAEGSAPMSRVIEGLQWVVDHQREYEIKIVNMSLGSDPSESYRNDPLCQAVEQVWQAGIVVTAAAGNDGPERGSVDTPGIDPMIITVGAMDDLGTAIRRDDVLPDFSSRGPTIDGFAKPDLLAPGVNIIAPQVDGGYVSRTGTSMSTPFVSGAAALLLSKEPDLQPDQVKRRLRAASDRDFTRSYPTRTGYLNVRNLLRLTDPAAKGGARGRRPPDREGREKRQAQGEQPGKGGAEVPHPRRPMFMNNPERKRGTRPQAGNRPASRQTVAEQQARLRAVLKESLFEIGQKTLPYPLLLMVISSLI